MENKIRDNGLYKTLLYGVSGNDDHTTVDCHTTSGIDGTNYYVPSQTDELNARIKQLEVENEELKKDLNIERQIIKKVKNIIMGMKKDDLS